MKNTFFLNKFSDFSRLEFKFLEKPKGNIELYRPRRIL